MTAIIHFSACIFMYICTQKDLTASYEGFFDLYGHDTTVPLDFYANSLISVTTTFTTIGYGNEVIISPAEKTMQMLLMIVGVLLISWIRDQLK